MVLAVLSLISICGGCKTNDSMVMDEEVTLKWVMPGPGKQKDADDVWNEFNKQLKTYPGLENVSVDFEVMDANDYAQKYQQTLAES